MPLILGLESSCDDSAVALVSGDRQILAQAVVGQNDAHRPFGGVVPEIAARAHVDILPGLIRQVMSEADVAIGEIDAIAATAGPGLIGGVMVALLAGKGLAIATGKPLIAVNHLEGHALSPRLVDRNLDFPYLLLLASGGHCQLLEVRGVGDYRRLATTIDDAAGEAFDKAPSSARLSRRTVDRGAGEGRDPTAVTARPCRQRRTAFSFAGLKGRPPRSRRQAQAQDFAASFTSGDRLHGRSHRIAFAARGAELLWRAWSRPMALCAPLCRMASRKAIFSVPPAAGPKCGDDPGRGPTVALA